MDIDIKDRNKLYKQGYIVIKDLLSSKEVTELSNAINKICIIRKATRVDDLYNYEETWNYIINEKLITKLRTVISKEIYYLNDSGISSFDEKYDGANKDFISWHRDTDSAPRIKDVVPYYKGGKFYNVFSAITYVSPKQKGGSLSIIPGSHTKKFRYSFKNLLRIFHWKTKKKRNIIL